MRIKIIGLLLLGCIISTDIFAQKDKYIIGFTYFTYNSYREKNYVDQISESISDELVKLHRFTIVDRTKLQFIKNERELQKSEDFIDGEIIEQGKSLGANYLITGNLASVVSNSTFNPEIKSYIFNASIILSLKLIDVTTGAVVAAETFGKGNAVPKVEGGFWSQFYSTSCDNAGSGASTNDAIRNATSNIGCGVRHWILKYFPVDVKIIEIEEEDKRKGYRSVLISAGRNLGLTKGKELAVVELQKIMIDDKEIIRNKPLGRLEVTKVEDENFAVCKVIEGGKEMKEKNEQKVPIKVLVQ